MRQPGDVPIGVSATTADMEAMKKDKEPIKLGRLVGTPEHAANLQFEVIRLEVALFWIKDQLNLDQESLASTIKDVLNGERHDTPGKKAASWEELHS